MPALSTGVIIELLQEKKEKREKENKYNRIDTA